MHVRGQHLLADDATGGVAGRVVGLGFGLGETAVSVNGLPKQTLCHLVRDWVENTQTVPPPLGAGSHGWQAVFVGVVPDSVSPSHGGRPNQSGCSSVSSWTGLRERFVNLHMLR